MRISYCLVVASVGFVLTMTADSVCLAQNRTIDSLQSAITASQNDTNTVNLLCELSTKIKNNHKKSLLFADSALRLALRIGYLEGTAKAYVRLAWANFGLSLYTEAITQAEQSAKIYWQIGNKRGYAHALNVLGNTKRNQGFYDDALRLHFQALQIREENNDIEGKAISLIISPMYIAHNKIMQKLRSIIVAVLNWIPKFTMLKALQPA